MFRYACVKQQMPELDMRNVKVASRMFNKARIGGFSRAISLPAVEEAQEMFAQCTSRNQPFGNEISIPNVVNANSMFRALFISSKFSVDKISMPKCNDARGMFAGVA